MHLEELKCIILDLDGPILDCKRKHYACYSDIIRLLGYSPLSIDEYWEHKRNKASLHEHLQLIGAQSDVTQFNKHWKDKIELKDYLKLDSLQKGVSQILEYWKSNNTYIGLVTMRNNAANVLWQLGFLDILKYFDRVEVVDSLKCGDADCKANAVASNIDYGILRESIWIGDTELDIEAAKSLGIPVCAVSCGIRNSGILSASRPDYLEQSLLSFVRKYGRYSMK